MEQEAYRRLLNEASVAWAAVCNGDKRPDAARVAGIAPVNDLSLVTFYLSEAMGGSVLETMGVTSSIALLTISMHTFESYQYKGICQWVRLCSEQEQEEQRSYLERFNNILQDIGIAQKETDIISKLYYQQPSYAVTFQVQKIFTQAPQKGAGSLVLNLEESE